MPHSGPDYDLDTGSAFRSSDLAELASRVRGGLGSTHRGGRVMFSTSFEKGIAELGRAQGGKGATIVADPNQSEFGPNQLRITGGAAIGDKAYVYRSVPGGVNTRMGFECGIMNLRSPTRWYMTLTNFPGGTVMDIYEWRVTVSSPSAMELAYRSGASAWTVWQTLGAPFLGFTFNNLKMVVDAGTRKYARLFINGFEQFFSGLPLTASVYSTVAGANQTPFFQLQFTVESLAAKAYLTIFVGSMVLTIDEP